MQQFAKVLDDRFGDDKIPQTRSSRKSAAGAIETEFALENLKEEIGRVQEKLKRDMDVHRENMDQVILKLMGKMNLTKGQASASLSIEDQIAAALRSSQQIKAPEDKTK